MRTEQQFKSSSGVPVFLVVEQTMNGRVLVIGNESAVRVTYGDGGKDKEYSCSDTTQDAPKWQAVLANFLNDKDVAVKPIGRKTKKGVKKSGD